jgi:hypothetical protein
LVIPQKRVWVLHVSTTPRADVLFSSPAAEKIDHYHIEQELGSLRLPEAVLASKRDPKPEAVLLAISKIDLFTDHDPNGADTTTQVQEVLNLFGRHQKRLAEECQNRGIPFQVILTSSLKNWGTNNLMQVLGHLYFPAKKART